MELPTLEEMLKTGMHFGHRTFKWHPKMKPYIYGQRQGVYIIDLEKAQANLQKALEFISDSLAANKTILLVGTKAQAKDLTKKTGQASGVSYVSERWLGGTITNFNIIRNSIRRYRDLLEKKATGKLEKYTKKERLNFDHEIARLEIAVGGLADLNRTPDIIFIWDIKHEATALAEAKKKGMKIIAVCDTNVDPTGIDFVIPANDDSSNSVKLILGLVEQAIAEGKAKAEEAKAKETKQVN